MIQIKKTLFIALLSLFTLSLSAQKSGIETFEIRDINPSEMITSEGPNTLTENHRLVKIEFNALKNIISPVGLISSELNTSKEIKLPHPDGTEHTYRIVKNSTVHPDLAAKFPETMTFNAYGISHLGEFGKIDITSKGFHGMVRSANNKTFFIDPYNNETKEDYIVYTKNNIVEENHFTCSVDHDAHNEDVFKTQAFGGFGTCELRKYRLAVAATGEYTSFHGGTVQDAHDAQVTTINRVNGVYEETFGITFEIIANNDLLIYTDKNTDPYSNGNVFTMLGENQSTVTSVIGSANYDIGHVFGKDSGGVASYQSVCSSQKAQGVTGGPSPQGDAFDIDYVCHEMGHQFGGSHTFNNSCDFNVNSGTAVEPGSGSTIMGYAGICDPNVQGNSDDHFHGVSIQEMNSFITTNSCAAKSNITNNTPVISSTTKNNTIIPSGTPFILRGTATDQDNDVLLYQWDQMDNESSNQPPVENASKGPNFRSFTPTSDSMRFIPNLEDLRQSQGKSTTWEVLSDANRKLDFRLIVKDFKSVNIGGNDYGIGCNDHKDITLSVDNNSGPFQITYPAELGLSLLRGAEETIIWDVAGTDAGVINCSEVDIVLSIDGGLTYTDTLANNVANDGEHTITIPNEPASSCRIMVVCSDHTFFNISPRSFSISQNSVGVNEIQNNSFKAYPNPTSETLNFYLKEVKPTQVSIVDVTGKLVYTDLINIQKSNINTSNLKKGMYFVQFKNETSSHTVKIIKD